MKVSVKDKVSHLKLIKDSMAAHGWSAAELSRRSGVSTGVLSRYLNKVLGMSDDNLFDVLCALGLIKNNLGKEVDDFMCGWDEKSRAACMKLKEILDSDDKFAVPAILSNLDAFRDSVDKTDRIKKIEAAVIELKKSNAALYLEPPKKRTGKKKTM